MFSKSADDRRYTLVANRRTIFFFFFDSQRSARADKFHTSRFWDARDQTRGLSSLAPEGGKMRDPGNELVSELLLRTG